MLAYRKIQDVINHQLTIVVPDYIDTSKVEIIVMPYIEPSINTETEVDFESFYGVSNIGKNNIDIQLKKLRNEWDVQISD